MIHLKRFVWLSLQMIQRVLWLLSGGRQEKAMGLALNLHPNTVWPGRRGLRLPDEHSRSKIVAFTDFVQAHALCSALEFMHCPVIIDVGAHHGAYAVLLGGLLKAHGGGVVIAVEPDNNNTSILKNNIARNFLQDIVQVVESAVSDSSGEMNFVSQGSEGYLCAGSYADSCTSLQVKVETLSEIIRRLGLPKVDLLLVDVEGAELPVLRSFPWDSMQPAMILCELHPYNWSIFGYTGKDMTDFLLEHQYRCLDMYFQEHTMFKGQSYIGPCLFLPR